jgi:hypothetical protein
LRPEPHSLNQGRIPLGFQSLADQSTRRAGNFAVQPIHLSLQLEAKMSIDDIGNGERINCNGVYGTVIGKRSTRNRRLVLVRMDNGFTLKLNPHTLSVKLPEAAAIAQLNEPTKQLASVD